MRNGEAGEATVGLIAAPDVPPRGQLTTGRNAAIPGMMLSTVNPAVIGEYALPLSAQGVVVDDPGQIGLRAGLRAGDILRGINDMTVETATEAEAALEEAERHLFLDVQRGTQRMTMRFRL